MIPELERPARDADMRIEKHSSFVREFVSCVPIYRASKKDCRGCFPQWMTDLKLKHTQWTVYTVPRSNVLDVHRDARHSFGTDRRILDNSHEVKLLHTLIQLSSTVTSQSSLSE